MALGVCLLSPWRLSLFIFSYWFLKSVTTKHWPRTGMPFSQVLERQKLDTLYLCSAFPLLSFIWATPKPECGVCCIPACSAQRRKWRVLVPILHLRSSLGKEAPLHLLLFVVADITSFPAQSVRVSCHSVKILLLLGGICWREGGRKGRGQDRVGEGRRGRCMSIKPACLKMRGLQEKYSLRGSQTTLPSSVCLWQSPSEQKPAEPKFPFLVSRWILPFYLSWQKRKKCNLWLHRVFFFFPSCSKFWLLLRNYHFPRAVPSCENCSVQNEPKIDYI